MMLMVKHVYYAEIEDSGEVNHSELDDQMKYAKATWIVQPKYTQDFQQNALLNSLSRALKSPTSALSNR